MIWTLLTRNPLARFIGWAVAGLVAFAGVWMAGRRSGAVRAENRGLREYQETRKAMDNVETGNDDPAVLRDWLRERGKSGGNL